MSAAARSLVRRYGAIVALVPKLYLAYSLWVWVEFFVQLMSMTIYVYFWRAVYAESSTLANLTLQQTLNYILLAQLLLPLATTPMILEMGTLVGEGRVALELLRPLDMQGRYYVETLTSSVIFLAQKLPLALFAWLVFGLQLPTDPLVWAVFALSLLVGQAAIFCFDWCFGCLAFYSTEVWGLAVVRYGVGMFFSGALLPLTMLPGWLQQVAAAMPFAQVMYVPVGLLSGILPLAEVPRLWATQAVWLAGLVLASRLIFKAAVRRVTVQGG